MRIIESRNAQYVEYVGLLALVEHRRSTIRLAFIIVIHDFESNIVPIPFQQERETADEITVSSHGGGGLHGEIVTQLSLLVVLGEVVRCPVERRFPRVGQGFAELGLEVFARFRLR